MKNETEVTDALAAASIRLGQALTKLQLDLDAAADDLTAVQYRQLRNAIDDVRNEANTTYQLVIHQLPTADSLANAILSRMRQLDEPAPTAEPEQLAELNEPTDDHESSSSATVLPQIVSGAQDVPDELHPEENPDVKRLREAKAADAAESVRKATVEPDNTKAPTDEDNDKGDAENDASSEAPAAQTESTSEVDTTKKPVGDNQTPDDVIAAAEVGEQNFKDLTEAQKAQDRERMQAEINKRFSHLTPKANSEAPADENKKAADRSDETESTDAQSVTDEVSFDQNKQEQEPAPTGLQNAKVVSDAVKTRNYEELKPYGMTDEAIAILKQSDELRDQIDELGQADTPAAVTAKEHELSDFNEAHKAALNEVLKSVNINALKAEMQANATEPSDTTND